MKTIAKPIVIIALMSISTTESARAQAADRVLDERAPTSQLTPAMPEKTSKEPQSLFMANNNIVGYCCRATATSPGVGEASKHVLSDASQWWEGDWPLPSGWSA